MHLLTHHDYGFSLIVTNQGLVCARRFGQGFDRPGCIHSVGLPIPLRLLRLRDRQRLAEDFEAEDSDFGGGA